jgi:dolichol-phosphate mannosyltransferase
VRARVAYAALALAVAGPLLAPGLVLAVDMNLVPQPHLAPSYWGLPVGTHAGPVDRLPIDLLFVALGHVGAVAVGQKAMLLAIVFLAGLGMHRIAPTERELGRFFAGVLYAVNPFVYDRLYSGEWYLLLGYALLPWGFRALLPLVRGEWRGAWRFAAVATAVGVVSPHMFALLGVLVLAVVAGALTRADRRRMLGAVALGCGLTLLASLYWLIPAPGLGELWAHVGPAQLRLYETVGGGRWGVAGAVLGLSGYWNDAAPISSYLRAWPLVALGLVVLAVWGLGQRRRDPLSWSVAGAAAFGFVLALGARGALTGTLFRDALQHVAAARSFREPQKGAALLAFGYAYLGAAAAGDLHAHASAWWSRRAAVAFAAALLALPLLGGYRELGGLWGGLRTSAYPSSWSQARAQLDREARDSRTLVLPWHGYFALSFAGGRVVANPAAAYFDTPVLASRSVGEGAAADDNTDALDRTVSSLLATGASRSDLGVCLAALGVSHVLVAKEADWTRYSFLGAQRDLVVERSWPDLVLYRDTRPAGFVERVVHLGRGPCGTRVAPLAARQTGQARLVVSSPPPRGQLLAVATPSDATWRLGGASGTRRGGLQLFRADGTSRVFALAAWGTLRRNYLLGVLGLLVAAASGVVRRRGDLCERHPDPVAARGAVWVVVPTYDEAENLAPMVRALLEAFAGHRLDGRILVVDDASPDGTGILADELAAADERVRVLHRAGKEGLGRAYVAGLAAALDGGAGFVVQMDCDFSHDPRDVPRLVAACADADVAVGSRYVRGGSVERWGLGRRLVSRLGCAYARLVLGAPVRDLTGGFKCFRREALRAIDVGTVEANGYGFQIETTYRALTRGLVVREVPIVFRDRTVGASKMTAAIAVEAALLVLRLRLAQAAAAIGRRRLLSSATVAAWRSAHASESRLVDRAST